jgi:predicted transcriptional regulator
MAEHQDGRIEEIRTRLTGLQHAQSTPYREMSVDTKRQILKAIEQLPDDASVEDALERLYLLYKIEKGLQQADSGELISQEEARQRMARWLK